MNASIAACANRNVRPRRSCRIPTSEQKASLKETARSPPSGPTSPARARHLTMRITGRTSRARPACSRRSPERRDDWCLAARVPRTAGVACDLGDRLDGGHDHAASNLCQACGDDPEVAREAGFVELERGIIKRFVNPAMYAAWGFGILLIATPGTLSWSAGWWWTKFIAVLALSGYHGALSAWRRGPRDGTDCHSASFYAMATV